MKFDSIKVTEARKSTIYNDATQADFDEIAVIMGLVVYGVMPKSGIVVAEDGDRLTVVFHPIKKFIRVIHWHDGY